MSDSDDDFQVVYRDGQDGQGLAGFEGISAERRMLAKAKERQEGDQGGDEDGYEDDEGDDDIVAGEPTPSPAAPPIHRSTSKLGKVHDFRHRSSRNSHGSRLSETHNFESLLGNDAMGDGSSDEDNGGEQGDSGNLGSFAVSLQTGMGSIQSRTGSPVPRRKLQTTERECSSRSKGAESKCLGSRRTQQRVKLGSGSSLGHFGDRPAHWTSTQSISRKRQVSAPTRNTARRASRMAPMSAARHQSLSHSLSPPPVKKAAAPTSLQTVSFRPPFLSDPKRRSSGGVDCPEDAPPEDIASDDDHEIAHGQQYMHISPLAESAGPLDNPPYQQERKSRKCSVGGQLSAALRSVRASVESGCARLLSGECKPPSAQDNGRDVFKDLLDPRSKSRWIVDITILDSSASREWMLGRVENVMDLGSHVDNDCEARAAELQAIVSRDVRVLMKSDVATRLKAQAGSHFRAYDPCITRSGDILTAAGHIEDAVGAGGQEGDAQDCSRIWLLCFLVENLGPLAAQSSPCAGL
jgi:hypothetical protein